MNTTINYEWSKLTICTIINRFITVADVNSSEYDADTEAEENVLLEDLYPNVCLTESNQTAEEVDLTCKISALTSSAKRQGWVQAMITKICPRRRSDARRPRQKK